jgi:hypothetical protein
MFVLDTSVLSELMQADPEPNVIRWLDQQPAESVCATTVTVFEVRYGLEILPNSRKRKKLEDLFERVLKEGLEQRVLSCDAAAAQCATVLAAKRHKSGRVIDFRDTLIAGIAISRRAKMVTRNIRHFRDLNIEIINPWTA